MSTQGSPPPAGGRRLDWRHLLAVIVGVLLAVPVTIVIGGNNDGTEPNRPHGKITVTLGGPKEKVPNQPSAQTITLDKKAQQIVQGAKLDDALNTKGGVENDLHETQQPTAAAETQAKKIQPPTQPEIPAQVPLAAASEPNCTSSFVRNFSGRRGAPIDLGVIHWTGSTSIPNSTADDLAIVRWFDTSAAQASSNYITDDDGHCYYVVPETLKSWTQAAANPWAVSVEHINPGVQPLFTSTAGKNAVIRLMIGWHHRWKLPYRLAAVNSNCVPIRTGYIDHHRLGPCGGGHPDVGTYPIVTLIREAAMRDGAGLKPLPPAQQKACDVLNFHRHRAHVVGKWYPSRVKSALKWKHQIPAGRCLSPYRHK